MGINKIMVIGAGQMGSGITQVAAAAGLDIILNDLNIELVNKGISVIDRNLTRDVSKGRLDETTKATIIGRIIPSTNIADAKDAQMVIEAATENMKIKDEIFKELDKITSTDTILASNTSSLPITEIGAFTTRPEKVIGMHFMNPVPVMKLVEIIRGLATSDETYIAVKELSERLGKVPVEVKDAPGFILNRILIPMINEAVYCVWEGTATPEAVDEIMKLGANHPMGPLALADLIGLDTCLSIMQVLHVGLGDSKYRPCPLLRKYVAAGWLGRKTGHGFFVYDK